MTKRVTIPCDSVVNRMNMQDNDPVAIKEFRKRIDEKGLNVHDKLILNFEFQKGFIVVQDYDIHTLWIKGMQTFSFDTLSKEEQSNRNLRKAYEERGGKSGITNRVPKRPTRKFFDMLLH